MIFLEHHKTPEKINLIISIKSGAVNLLKQPVPIALLYMTKEIFSTTPTSDEKIVVT
jgi:hypothetical protein